MRHQVDLFENLKKMLNWIWGGKEEKKESSGLGGGATEKIVFEGVTVKECLDVISNCEKYTEL